MQGYVTKRGKRIGSKVRRWMVMHGYVLSNHHARGAAATWAIDVRDAMVTANARRCRITLQLHGHRVDLFTDTVAECDQWYEALTNAKSVALLHSDTAGRAAAAVEDGEEKEKEEVDEAVYDRKRFKCVVQHQQQQKQKQKQRQDRQQPHDDYHRDKNQQQSQQQQQRDWDRPFKRHSTGRGTGRKYMYRKSTNSDDDKRHNSSRESGRTRVYDDEYEEQVRRDMLVHGVGGSGGMTPHRGGRNRFNLIDVESKQDEDDDTSATARTTAKLTGMPRVDDGRPNMDGKTQARTTVTAMQYNNKSGQNTGTVGSGGVGGGNGNCAVVAAVMSGGDGRGGGSVEKDRRRNGSSASGSATDDDEYDYDDDDDDDDDDDFKYDNKNNNINGFDYHDATANEDGSSSALLLDRTRASDRTMRKRKSHVKFSSDLTTKTTDSSGGTLVMRSAAKTTSTTSTGTAGTETETDASGPYEETVVSMIFKQFTFSPPPSQAR